jgi:2-dehydropantoate 2-reductase
MRFSIVGSGAIGGLTGAFLARHGEDVHFFDVVPEHVDAMNNKGLYIDGVAGEFTVACSASLMDALSGPLDVVMVAVKSQHTAAALDAIEPHLTPASVVVSLQNGLNAARIAERIGSDRVVAVFLNFGADYIGPGHVRFGGKGDYFIGRIDSPPDEPVLTLAEKLGRIQNTVATDNISGYLWSKLCWSSLLSGTALVEEPIFDAVGTFQNREVFTAAFRELVAVSDAHGTRLEPFYPFNPDLFRDPLDHPKVEAFFDEVVHMYRSHVKQHSGTWRDLAVRKRKTEVEGLLGDLVRKGQRAGLPVPVASRIVEMISEIEQGSRRQSQENLDELHALIGQTQLPR